MIDISQTIGTLIKVFDLIFLVLFIIYSLLTLRQVSIMNHSVVTHSAIWLQFIALLQLGFGIVVLVVIWTTV